MVQWLKYIPKKRHVPWDDAIEVADGTDGVESTAAIQPDANVRLLEYRDENGRPWWKFFDEYEYRMNKFDRQKSKWWKFYDDGTSSAEKKLLFKLDLTVTLYCMLIFWIKSLDQSNFEKAYSSGYKEEIGFKGNDYINTVTVFNVALVVLQLPFMYIFPRYSMHYVVPILDVCWGLFTLGLYKAQNVGQVQVLRFFVGAFEAGFYPGAHYLFGSWYLPHELGRRTSFWYLANMIGYVSSGLFQASIYEHLDGARGISGSRWMFIIDAAMTIPVGLLGFFILPGTPQNCYSLWLTDDEIKLARRRLARANIETQVREDVIKEGFFTWKLWKRILCDWRTWGLTIFDISGWNSSNTQGSGFIFWLKSLKRYTIPKMNNLSSTSAGVGFVLVFLSGVFADSFKCRYGAIVITQLLNLVGNIILSIWDVREGAKWFAFMLQYSGWATASIRYSWINDFLRTDPQDRAIIFVIQFAVAQSTTIWINRLIWPTVDSPVYHAGYTAVACFASAMIVAAFVLLYVYKRAERKVAYENGIVLYNSANGDVPEKIAEQIAERQLRERKTNSKITTKEVAKESASESD